MRQTTFLSAIYSSSYAVLRIYLISLRYPAVVIIPYGGFSNLIYYVFIIYFSYKKRKLRDQAFILEFKFYK